MRTDLTGDQKLLVGRIIQFGKSGCYAKRATLAQWLGMSERSVFRHIKTLLKEGVLSGKNGALKAKGFHYDKLAETDKLAGMTDCQGLTDCHCQIVSPSMTDCQLEHDKLAVLTLDHLMSSSTETYISEEEKKEESEDDLLTESLAGLFAESAPSVKHSGKRPPPEYKSDPDFMFFMEKYPRPDQPTEAFNHWRKMTRADKANALQGVLDRNALPGFSGWGASEAQYINFAKKYLRLRQWNEPLPKAKSILSSPRISQDDYWDSVSKQKENQP